MERAPSKRATTVRFWDGYARWYKLWMEHTDYHRRIIDVLQGMTEPGWIVLDVGAGNGVLSIPLSIMGCDVTAVEPSAGMRDLLYEEAFRKRVNKMRIDACGFWRSHGKHVQSPGSECLFDLRGRMARDSS